MSWAETGYSETPHTPFPAATRANLYAIDGMGYPPGEQSSRLMLDLRNAAVLTITRLPSARSLRERSTRIGGRHSLPWMSFSAGKRYVEANKIAIDSLVCQSVSY